MRVTALVPMRHDSERVPGKNFRLFNGRPLFHYVLETLQAVKMVDQIVVDTDSLRIRRDCAEIFPHVHCFERPGNLRGGDVPMTEILRHDARLFPSEWYLQTHATNPLLQPSTVTDAICALSVGLAQYDSLMSVTRLQARLYDAEIHPINHDPNRLQRTQDLEPLFVENSNIYLFGPEQIEAGNRFGIRPLLFEMPAWEATDIDYEEDFVLAEALHRLRIRGEL